MPLKPHAVVDTTPDEVRDETLLPARGTTRYELVLADDDDLVLRRETFDPDAGVYVGDLECPDCGRRYLDQRPRSHPRKAAPMAKRGRDGYPKATDKPKRGRPRQQDLIDDRAIKPLEDAAADYAELRDERMRLTEQESGLKAKLLSLMKKHQKTTYDRDGIHIEIVHEDETIKVRVKKLTESGEELGDDEDAGEQVGADA